jgi:Protein of unknown function (DUF2726)
MEREDVLQTVFKEDWGTVLSWLHKQQHAIARDANLQFAAGVVASEFFRKVPDYALDRADIFQHLMTLLGLHWGRLYKLTPDQDKVLMVQLALRNLTDKEQAYSYAMKYPDEEPCRRIIAEYERNQPKAVAHSQSGTIRVTQQPDREQPVVREHRIRLFKSGQEKQLFRALIEAFPNHHVYPNVAISCLLDFHSLKGHLSKAEKDFYFKGIVDFVIFNQAQGYLPIFFFELDSAWHDTPSVQRNDELKDGIFSKAGLPLLRIRKLSDDVAVEEFIELIRELTK